MKSAGLLMCRLSDQGLEYFLVHPGGPYFIKKQEGYWTIPKGLPEKNENLLEAAQREFLEETGIKPSLPFHELGSVKQKGGKTIHAWTFIGDWNAEQGLQCNEFEIEWPPRSGSRKKFPEVDKAEWMFFDKASMMINEAQRFFLQKAKEIYESTP
jgi:predicted NUDIX family NTP pyrophosphohydrolase